MLVDFGNFILRILNSSWNMLNSSSGWMIFSFIVAGVLHEFLKPEKVQKLSLIHIYRLYTMEDSRNKEMHGNGLGLSIARTLAGRMGGDITLDSVPGQETVFTLKMKRHHYLQ